MADNHVECPVCSKKFPPNVVNNHVNQCINSLEEELDEEKSPMKESNTCNVLSRANKRMRLDDADAQSSLAPSSAASGSATPERTGTRGNVGSLSRASVSSSSGTQAGAAWAALGLNMKGPSVGGKSPSHPRERTSKSKLVLRSNPDLKENQKKRTMSKNEHAAVRHLALYSNDEAVPTTSKRNLQGQVNSNKAEENCSNYGCFSTPDLLDTRNSFMDQDWQERVKRCPDSAPGTRDRQLAEHSGLPEEREFTYAKKNLFGRKSHNDQDIPPKFNNNHITEISYDKPLAEQMRPSCIAEYVGQEQVLGKEKLLRTLVEAHRIPSMILWGPPGCGKTTLARIIAKRCKESHNTRFASLSATMSGVNDVREMVKVARNEKKFSKRSTILFIDEIHRFNKSQQDTFLPHVEDGTLILVGATTENPSFQVNNALLSRCRVITLEKLSVKDIQEILKRSLVNLGVMLKTTIFSGNETDIMVEEAALTALAHLCDGDARVALNSLQTALSSKTALQNSKGDSCVVTVDDIKEGLQRSHIQYDRAGEDHYNCASALQKSIRGSDENAAIYWFSRMIEGGEDPLFIARRLVVTASEDIGLADPHALPLAVSTMQACQLVGLPECSINLAHCVAYLAKAPKSNESYQAMQQARQLIKDCSGPQPGVPLHLRNAPTNFMKKIGYGKGYKYPHGHSDAGDQIYLPDSLLGVNFFKKTSR